MECLIVLCISDVFSGFPSKVKDAGAGESVEDIRKLINNAHSKAYGAAIREATLRGESKARHFSIFGFNVLKVF